MSSSWDRSANGLFRAFALLLLRGAGTVRPGAGASARGFVTRGLLSAAAGFASAGSGGGGAPDFAGRIDIIASADGRCGAALGFNVVMAGAAGAAGATDADGGAPDMRGGESSARSLSQTPQRAEPMALHVSH